MFCSPGKHRTYAYKYTMKATHHEGPCARTAPQCLSCTPINKHKGYVERLKDCYAQLLARYECLSGLRGPQPMRTLQHDSAITPVAPGGARHAQVVPGGAVRHAMWCFSLSHVSPLSFALCLSLSRSPHLSLYLFVPLSLYLSLCSSLLFYFLLFSDLSSPASLLCPLSSPARCSVAVSLSLCLFVVFSPKSPCMGFGEGLMFLHLKYAVCLCLSLTKTRRRCMGLSHMQRCWKLAGVACQVFGSVPAMTPIVRTPLRLPGAVGCTLALPVEEEDEDEEDEDFSEDEALAAACVAARAADPSGAMLVGT